ncbi:hypothetical protein [Methylobacterium gregans]|uniref:hypothetical protein n=1 Tax=Methylobacterium gregans TaxID=374424 RepID=UPI003619980C
MSETQHFPDADTHQARAARDRQAARDRAQRWREERRAEVDGLRARVVELEVPRSSTATSWSGSPAPSPATARRSPPARSR